MHNPTVLFANVNEKKALWTSESKVSYIISWESMVPNDLLDF